MPWTNTQDMLTGQNHQQRSNGDVRKSRWKFIGYIGKISTAMTWAPERRQRWVDPGKHGEGEQRRRERKSWMEELERGVHSTANRAC